MMISIYMDRGILLFCCVLALLLGAVLGSFLNCAAWRIVRSESFLTGRSRCPRCGHVLGALELVPIFSWLFQHGRCRQCKQPIPARYPLTELFFAFVTLACLLRFDLTLLCARNLVFFSCLFCLSLVDLENMTIPNGCLLIAALAWAVAEPFLARDWADAGHSLLAGFVFGGALLLISLVMDHILGKETLGGGDIKLFALVGLYLGLVGTLFTLILSCVLGIVFALLTRHDTEQAFPFGPAIALSSALMLLFGSGLVDWYMGFFIF